MMRNRGGHGILITMIAIVVVTLAGASYTALYRQGAAARDQGFAQGRKALQLARSALSEALLHFKSEMNVEGSRWSRALRDRRTSTEGMATWLVDEHEPEHSRAGAAAGENFDIAAVRVSVWRDFPFEPGAGSYDEKYALLTLTADVTVPEPGIAFFRGKVRRQLQRSFYLKQTRVVAPQPFGRYTVYVHHLPSLERQKEAYDRSIRAFSERRQLIEKHYETEIEHIVRVLHHYIAWMRRKVADFRDTRGLIKKTEEDLKKQEGLLPLSMGLALPAVEKLRKVLADLREGLRKDIERTLRAFNLSSEEVFTQVAQNPYPPENLKTDIGLRLARGEWPPFRGYEATDQGLTGGGENLDNPVVSVKPRVTTREIDYRLPPAPELPRRPTYSLAANQIDWTARYRGITHEFRRYNKEYDDRLKAFLGGVALEFSRHEETFQVLPQRPAGFESELTNFAYQARRAAHFFDRGADLVKSVVGPDGVARLDGIYAIKGDLTQFPAHFEGRGLLVVQNDVTLGTVRRFTATDAAPSTLVILAGRNISIGGPCEAGLLAPLGRIRSGRLDSVVDHAIVGGIDQADEFTIQKSPLLGDEGPTGLWVNVAPARLAEALLRH